MVKSKNAKRLFTWTCNNYTQEHIDRVHSIPAKYIIYGKEIAPTTGTPHLQGFIYFTNARDLNPVINEFGNGFSVFASVGTLYDNIDYCAKDFDYTELGERPKKKGERTDLAAIAEDLNKISLGEVIDKYPDKYIMYHRGIEKLHYHIMEKSAKHWRNIKVHVLWGISGAGKTSRFYNEDTYCKVYVLPETSSDHLWFDGYNGEEYLLLDEFYGNIKYRTLLRLLDGHPLQLEIKGGFTWAMWHTVYITSNTHPQFWYPNICCEGLTPALARRLHHIEYAEPVTLLIN